jgi:hypothetical protein
MNFADKLRFLYARDIFTVEDIAISFNRLSNQAIQSGISRSLYARDFLQLKRGIYTFGDRLQRKPVSLFSIANKVYAPSFISFESALSYHGLIPEAVHVITSTCYQRKKKNFRTPFGDFSYDYVPLKPFFLGVEHDNEKGGVLMANPLRALFDFLYLYKKQYKSLEDLEEDIRLDTDTLQKAVNKHSFKALEKLAKPYKNRKITAFFEILVRELK